MKHQRLQINKIAKLLENSLHSMKIELSDSTDRKNLFVSVGFVRVDFLFLKISKNPLFCL